jgi:RimJ/RimL family protein N-acetyltransferase
MATFPFETEIILENERVLLRPLQKTDESLLLPFAKNEPDLWKYALISVKNEAELSNYIVLALIQKEKKLEYPFVIIDKLTGQIAGSTRFYAINEKEASISIGYTWIGKDFQGTGLNRAMKSCMLDFIFKNLQFERLEFRADAENLQSIKAIQSIGATMEGILRSHVYKPDGTRRNSVVLSILKSEFIR